MPKNLSRFFLSQLDERVFIKTSKGLFVQRDERFLQKPSNVIRGIK